MIYNYFNLPTKLVKPRLIRSIFRFNSSNSRLDSNVLSDIRILDLTRIVAGPFCTMILGDMGAEIIKVERISSGDEARKWGPPFIESTSESCYFISVNRNKKSICVDFKSESGREIIYELAKISDVLVENFVPGTLNKLGLGYDHLRRIAPRLIYCSITGYGSDGPYKNRPGYDVIAASVGGLLNVTGPKDGEPVKVGVAATDLATGLYAHGAILAALIQRTKNGLGQKIDCNLLSTQIASLINIGSNYLNSGKEGERLGSAHASLVPYQMFKTKDGFLTIGTGSDAQFRDFCNRIGKEHLADDEKYITNSQRVLNRDDLIEIIENVIKQKKNKEWMKILGNASFACGPVNKLSEVFSDCHVQHLGLVETVNHPKLGDIKVVGPPVKFSGGINKVRSAPPLLGEHTNEILKNYLNYSDDEIRKLKEKLVVQ